MSYILGVLVMSMYAKREIRRRIFYILYTLVFVVVSTYIWLGYRDNIKTSRNISFSRVAYAEKLDFKEITKPLDVNLDKLTEEDEYIFSITNKSSKTISYLVSFRSDTNKIGSDGCSRMIPNNYIKYRIKRNDEEYSPIRSLAVDGKVYLDYLDSGATSVFSIKYWIDDSAYNYVKNGHFHSKIALINNNYS